MLCSAAIACMSQKNSRERRRCQDELKHKSNKLFHPFLSAGGRGSSCSGCFNNRICLVHSIVGLRTMKLEIPTRNGFWSSLIKFFCENATTLSTVPAFKCQFSQHPPSFHPSNLARRFNLVVSRRPKSDSQG